MHEAPASIPNIERERLRQRDRDRERQRKAERDSMMAFVETKERTSVERNIGMYIDIYVHMHIFT
jgi:hypothetical protein